MNSKEQENTKTTPFLRWAGGKRWLVSRLRGKFDMRSFSSYHEPFVGGGAMLFAFQPQHAFISDANVHLMKAYQMLKEDKEGVFEFLRRFPVNEETYYFVRSMTPDNDTEAAGKFIYLNRTSFNGIYRENLKGEYNVPWGKKDGFKFDFKNLDNVSQYLQGVTISEGGDFEQCLEFIQEGSLCFLDPPYTISKKNNVFIKYNQRTFSVDDQQRLSNMIDEIRNRGAYYILTNANHEQVKEIFDKGDNVIELTRSSLIGGTNAERGDYEECIFTNLNLPL